MTSGSLLFTILALFSAELIVEGVPVDDGSTTTAAACPPLIFFCTIDCPAGIGPDGCAACICDQSCKETKCEKNQKCELKKPDDCPDETNCDPKPTCVAKQRFKRRDEPCPVFRHLCPINCPARPTRPDGCLQCTCLKSCKGFKCENYERCEMRKPQNCSDESECRPRPTCVLNRDRNCPGEVCDPSCPSGYVTDKNGCLQCQCQPEPTADPE